MKQTIILALTLILLCFIKTQGQVKQLYIGNTGLSGCAMGSTLLSNGTQVIVGSKTSSSGNDNAFISCLDTADNLLWSKEIGTSNHDRFMAVTATSDGGCVAVGYFDEPLTTPYGDTKAGIYKLDASGTILWNYIFDASTVGEYLYGVIETPGTHDIICAGICNFGITPCGLVMSLNSGGSLNWAKRYNTSAKNEIHDIGYHKGKLIITGLYTGTTYYDGFLVALKETDGSFVWGRSFDYASYQLSSANTQWPDRIQIVDDRFYVDAFLSASWGATPVTPTLISFDSSGLNPYCLEYPISGKISANVIHSRVVSANEIYLFQNTADTYWDRLHSHSPISDMVDVTCTKIKDITNPSGTMVFSRKIGSPGQQGIVCTEYKNNTLRGWGGSIDDPGNLIGVQDIFRFSADSSFPVTATNCIVDEYRQVFGNPPVTINPTFNYTSITAISPITTISPAVTSITYSTATPCKATPTGPKADFSNENNCLTVRFTDLSTIGSAGIKIWSWSFGDGNGSALQHPVHSYDKPGTYTVKLVIEDFNGMTDSVSRTILIEQYRFANAGNDTILCSGQDTAVQINLHATGGKEYLWIPGTHLSDATIANPVAALKNTQTYIVRVTDDNGCIDYDTITIRIVPPAIHVQAGPKIAEGCLGDKVQLEATGGTMYRWFPPSGLSNDIIPNPILTITGNYVYTVSSTDENGCIDTDTISMVAHPQPDIKISSEEVVLDCKQKTVTLHASGADSLEWYPAVYCENHLAPSTKVFPPITTVFTVKGVNEYGCKDESDIKVEVRSESVVKVPNAFTPNSDNINDRIKPIIVCNFTMKAFMIYNRWGEQVFLSNNPNYGWDGTYKGQPCAANVYYYLLTGKDNNGIEVLLKGDITLIR